MTNCYFLIEAHYFPNIQYFTKIITNKNIIINDKYIYKKQTYSNRTYIYGSNKIIPLIVPIKNHKKLTTSVKDIEISYAQNWQKNHWRTIKTSYNNSPFFMYYEDDFSLIFSKKYKYLLDLNLDIINICTEIIQLDKKYELLSTKNFSKSTNIIDFSEKINPKKPETDKNFVSFKYYQVFQEKLGFVPNLSIMDLIFNEGTNVIQILKKHTSLNI